MYRKGDINVRDANIRNNLVVSGTSIFNKVIFDVNENENLLYVSTVGNDVTGNGSIHNSYRTIKMALASITGNTSSNRYAVVVEPGVYAENNPIIGKEFVSITSIGGMNTSIIYALNPNDTLYQAAASSTIFGFTLTNVTGGTAMVFSDNGISSLQNVTVNNCLNGLLCSGSTSGLQGNNVFVNSQLVTMDTVVDVAAGGSLKLVTLDVVGDSYVDKILHVYGSGSTAEVAMLISSSHNVETAMYLEDECRVDVVNPVIYHSNTALYMDNGAHAHMSSGIFGDIYDYGLHIGPNGESHLDVVGLHFHDVNVDSMLDLFIESPTAIFHGMNTSVARDKYQSASPYVYGFGLSEFDHKFRSASDFAVGLDGDGAASQFGEGGPYFYNTKVLSYDGAVYADVTTGATITFPNLNVNSALYFGDGDGTDFYGITYNMGANQIDGGSIVWEYYDGGSASWLEFNTITNIEGYSNLATQFSGTSGTDYSIRFDQDIKTGVSESNAAATGNTSVSVNGITAKWVRCRIATTLIKSPTISDIRFKGNYFSIRPNGTVGYEGEARSSNIFKIQTGIGAGSTGNVTVRPSPNVISYGRENGFIAGATDATSGNFTITENIDLSCGIKMVGTFQCENTATGTANIRLGHVAIPKGTRLNASYPNETSVNMPIPVTTGISETPIEIILADRIDISDVQAGDVVYFEFERLSGDNVNLAGNITLLNFTLEYREYQRGKNTI